MVWPAAIVIEDGDTVTLEVSLLTRFTLTPPGGAGDGRVTAKAADSPRLTVVFDGTPMASVPCTLTVSVVSARSGSALA